MRILRKQLIRFTVLVLLPLLSIHNVIVNLVLSLGGATTPSLVALSSSSSLTGAGRVGGSYFPHSFQVVSSFWAAVDVGRPPPPSPLRANQTGHHAASAKVNRNSSSALSAVLPLRRPNQTLPERAPRTESTSLEGISSAIGGGAPSRPLIMPAPDDPQTNQLTTHHNQNTAPLLGENTTSPFSFPYTVDRSQDVYDAAMKDVARIAQCRGKGRLLEILRAADFVDIDPQLCAALPTWEDVTKLYGEYPVVYGMETCATYRSMLAQGRVSPPSSSSSSDGSRGSGGGPATAAVTTYEPIIGVSGLFNSGTNAFAKSLRRNLRLHDDIINPPSPGHHVPMSFSTRQIPWDKHIPARYKWNSTYSYLKYNDSFILPIVLIRDPYWWMVSMCKESYGATWSKAPNCPNLLYAKPGQVPTADSPKNMVRAEYQKKFSETYRSLADMWNDWYRPYFDADYPRLIIRFEDQLFHAEKVMELISQCTGIPLKSTPYSYLLQRSKGHGKSANFVSALIKYSVVSPRYDRVFNEDVRYAQRTLDAELMRIFQYRHVPTHADDQLAIDTSMRPRTLPDIDPAPWLGRWSLDKGSTVRTGRVPPRPAKKLTIEEWSSDKSSTVRSGQLPPHLAKKLTIEELVRFGQQNPGGPTWQQLSRSTNSSQSSKVSRDDRRKQLQYFMEVSRAMEQSRGQAGVDPVQILFLTQSAGSSNSHSGPNSNNSGGGVRGTRIHDFTAPAHRPGRVVTKTQHRSSDSSRQILH